MTRTLKDLGHPYFVGVLLAWLALAAMWSLALPVHEGPDEQNHYRFMVFLKDQVRLPRQLPLPPEVPGEGHQPPLYYALGAATLGVFAPHAAFVEPRPNPALAFNRNPAYWAHDAAAEPGLLRFVGQAWPPHLLRLLQLPLGLATLALLWLALARLAGPHSAAAQLGLAFAALNPAYVALAGGLNNDHLLIPLFTAALALMALAWQEGRMSPGRALVLGMLVGLGAMTKITMLGLAPLAMAVVWLASPRGRRAAHLALALAAFAALAGWWLARNVALYGDPVGWSMHSQTCANTYHPKRLLDAGWWLFWARVSLESYWGVFGWMTFTLPAWMLAAFELAALAAGLGCVLRWRDLAPGAPKARAAWVLAAGLALLAVGVARFNLVFDPPEGRYFYPGILPLACVMGFGLAVWLRRLPPRLAKAAPWLALAALAAVNAWLLAWRMIPLYYVGL